VAGTNELITLDGPSGVDEPGLENEGWELAFSTRRPRAAKVRLKRRNRVFTAAAVA
jgi:hypothetical protein